VFVILVQYLFLYVPSPLQKLLGEMLAFQTSGKTKKCSTEHQQFHKYRKGQTNEYRKQAMHLLEDQKLLRHKNLKLKNFFENFQKNFFYPVKAVVANFDLSRGGAQ